MNNLSTDEDVLLDTLLDRAFNCNSSSLVKPYLTTLMAGDSSGESLEDRLLDDCLIHARLVKGISSLDMIVLRLSYRRLLTAEDVELNDNLVPYITGKLKMKRTITIPRIVPCISIMAAFRKRNLFPYIIRLLPVGNESQKKILYRLYSLYSTHAGNWVNQARLAARGTLSEWML